MREDIEKIKGKLTSEEMEILSKHIRQLERLNIWYEEEKKNKDGKAEIERLLGMKEEVKGETERVVRNALVEEAPYAIERLRKRVKSKELSLEEKTKIDMYILDTSGLLDQEEKIDKRLESDINFRNWLMKEEKEEEGKKEEGEDGKHDTGGDRQLQEGKN